MQAVLRCAIKFKRYATGSKADRKVCGRILATAQQTAGERAHRHPDMPAALTREFAFIAHGPMHFPAKRQRVPRAMLRRARVSRGVGGRGRCNVLNGIYKTTHRDCVHSEAQG